MLQNGLDVVRRALGVHQHPARVLPLDPGELGEHLVVLRRGDVRDELPAPGRHEEVEVPDLGGERSWAKSAIASSSPRLCAPTVVCTMKGRPVRLRISRALDGVLPGAAHAPEAVVPVGSSASSESDRPRAPASARSRARFSVMCTPLVPTTTQSPRAAAWRTISRMSRRSSGSPPVRIVSASGAKAAISSTTLKHCSVPSSLRSAKSSVPTSGLPPGVEVAVLAGEVAAVGQVPGDDVGPRERPWSAGVECIA